MAVAIKEAVTKAVEFCGEVFPKASEVQLEEVVDTDETWQITLSFRLARPNPNDLVAFIGPSHVMKYKVFSVDRETGEVKSVKIRELQSAPES